MKKLFFAILLFLNKKIWLNKLWENQYLIVLNLHRVSPEENPFYPALSPALFEELLKFIGERFNVITFREIEQYRESKKPNIILSFDDGFYDFLEYAMPLLEKYGMKANQNVIPHCIETGEPVWDVKLGDFLNQAPRTLINEIDLPGFDMKLSASNKTRFALALTHYLKQRPREERESLWQRIEDAMQKTDMTYTRMLNRSEVMEVAKIHEIGVHSYSHESMGIESEAFFREDFFRCKNYFQNRLDIPMDIYAYPSGSYRETQFPFLREQGIAHILLVNEAYAGYGTDVYNRFTFYGDSKSEIRLRALGWHR